jgi:hypothetical protein
LRRKNVEGLTTEETNAQKNVSMTSAETDEKMTVSSQSVEEKSKEGTAVEWKFSDG